RMTTTATATLALGGRLLRLELFVARLLGVELRLQGRHLGGVLRVRELRLQLRLVGVRLVDLALELQRLRLEGRRLVGAPLDRDAGADAADDDDHAEGGEDHREALLVLVLPERVELPLVLL